MRIAFLLPRIELAGGIFIVLEHARGLARAHGHDVTIVTTEDDVVSHAYSSLSDLTLAGIEEVAGCEFDLAIATWWHTVYSLPRIIAPKYAHFIQNLEGPVLYLPRNQQPKRSECRSDATARVHHDGRLASTAAGLLATRRLHLLRAQRNRQKGISTAEWNRPDEK